MAEPHLDLFVIGGGSGGVACARRAASHGAKVALCEASRLGGTCVIRGCVPKKLMHYGAHFADHFKAARGYGWEVGTPAHDWTALLEARNAEIARLNGIYTGMLERAGVAIVEGWGRITGHGADGFTIAVGERRFTATRVLIAVGGRPFMPEIPGMDLAVTSDEILENVYPLPKSVAVVGGGYIGVELASILRGFGCETRIVIRGDEPLRGFDGDLRTALTMAIAHRGIEIRNRTNVLSLARSGDGIVLATDSGLDLTADLVVYATGRSPIPQTRGIGLEDLGVRLTGSGAVYVDAGYESNVPGLFSVGDCSDHGGNDVGGTGGFDLTPIAIAEGRVIAETLFNANPHHVAYDTVPTAVFAIPQAASVGLTEERAKALGHSLRIYRTSFRPLLQTLTGEQERIMMKLVVDAATDRVLGCHMVGDEAAEIIQGLAVALTAGATKAHFDATVGVHPSAAEEFVTMYQPVVT